MYGALAILCFAEALSGSLLGEAIRFLVLIISAGGVLASGILMGIEAFRLHAWCAWCVLSAVVVTLIFILAIDGVRRPSLPSESLAALNAVRGQFVLFVIALAVGIAAFVHLAHSGEFALAKPASAAVLDQRLVRPDSHVTGNPQSPVAVVEFGDFECQMCKLAQASVEQMLKQFGSRIRFVFRQFPMSSVDAHMHPEAEKAAEASECAAEQGKFWQADQLFFQKQPDLSVANLESYASQLGLNTSQFDQCLSSGAMASRVHQDFQDGWAVGVRGTPTFFVGHQMIAGPPNYPELAQLLDDQLAGHGAATAQGGSTPPPGANLNSGGAPPSSNGPQAASSSPGGAGTLGVASPFAQIQQSNPLTCNANESSMPQPTLIRTPEAQRLFEASPKPVFVDVREPRKFAAGHITGAINIPVEEIEQKWNRLPKDRMIVFYEGGEQGGSPDDVCAFSRAAARVLFLHGFDRAKVKVYQDGLKGWEKAGLPVSR
jgi:protein-disulfide isomerase/rhodanese-related sulfurtransferase